MKKEFVIRGRTASGQSEKLSFSGHKKGYAYKIVEFALYPTSNIPAVNFDAVGSITAGKPSVDPTDPDFRLEGLIATTLFKSQANVAYPADTISVLNDTFLITQDLILTVRETDAGLPVNWQCRFESVKMSGPEEAVANYRQFLISDD